MTKGALQLPVKSSCCIPMTHRQTDRQGSLPHLSLLFFLAEMLGQGGITGEEFLRKRREKGHGSPMFPLLTPFHDL